MAEIAISQREHDAWALSALGTRYLVPLGRIFFATIFVLAAFGHFTRATIDYAVSQGVPLAHVTVPLAGVLALFGGLSVALGYHTRLGALLLVLFLVPVTLMMHRFWALADPSQAMIQRVMFLKNLAMTGGALLLLHFGGGPFSLDARYAARASRPSD